MALHKIVGHELDWLRQRFIVVPPNLLGGSNLFTALHHVPYPLHTPSHPLFHTLGKGMEQLWRVTTTPKVARGQYLFRGSSQVGARNIRTQLEFDMLI